MSPESLQATLGALRKAGSVFGVLFSRGNEEIFSDLAYTPERVADLAAILDDIVYYFEQEKRAPDTLAFSYDGGNLLIILRENYRLVVLHHNADEADFVAAAGGAFLKDFLLGKAVEEFSLARTRPVKPVVATQPTPTLAPKRTVDPTAPISPVA